MLSSLSVSCRPDRRLRHWCSSIYLRIPPLHMEFHSPLLHSRKTVSDAVPRLSRGLSHQTYSSACARFTPNKSGQRLPPTYYRGCWHVVSRDFLSNYRQIKASYYLYLSSLPTELYEHPPRLSRGLSHQTYSSACARFTPNKSGQRLPPTYYRGCWHVVSRGFLGRDRQGMNILLSSLFLETDKG